MNSAESKIEKIERAAASLEGAMKACRICPRACSSDRQNGKYGYCRAPANPVIYSYLPHRGEEPPISGRSGSGTIFFTYCNMKCVYCQNYYFSQLDSGSQVSAKSLAEIMLALANKGCHNINLVNPTHFVPQILEALKLAYQGGLDIPIVYNSSGYEKIETLKLLDGIIDIYLPDMRYSDDSYAEKYSGAKGYVGHNRSAVVEMHKQVGALVTDENGMAKRGLIIRLLVMPNDISGAKESLRFIKLKISQKTYVSIMSQYYPTYRAYNFTELSRGLFTEEYENVVDEVRLLGLNNGWIQECPAKTDARFLGTNIKERGLTG